jgi:hypothetical protein
VKKQKVEKVISDRKLSKAREHTAPQGIKPACVDDDWLRICLGICLHVSPCDTYASLVEDLSSMCICVPVSHIFSLHAITVRPQGRQAREHGCRQLLQLVAGKVQKSVEKQQVEKIISASKQDTIRRHKVSGRSWSWLLSRLNSWLLSRPNNTFWKNKRWRKTSAPSAGCRKDTKSCGKTKGGEKHQREHCATVRQSSIHQ